MSLLIKGGDIVAADRTFKSDILIEGESIKAIGTGLSGTDVIDASGCFVMPGGIDPHTHLEMPFMGTTSADHYESGTKAALSGGTTMVVDFCIPNERPAAARSLGRLGQEIEDRLHRLRLPHVHHLLVGRRCARRWRRSSSAASPPSSISWPTRAP